MYTIDKDKRQVIIKPTIKGAVTLDENVITLNEFDSLYRHFLPNTQDKYECELVLIDVPVYNDKFEEIGIETKAFSRRKGNDNWLIEFVEEEYRF